MINSHSLQHPCKWRAIFFPIAIICLVTACGDDNNSQASNNASSAAESSNRSSTGFTDRRNFAQDPSPDNAADTLTDNGSNTQISNDPSVTLNVDTPNSGSGAAELAWESTNVDTCTASGAWEGSRPAVGNDSIELDEAGDHTFLLTCEGGAGSAVAMVTVNLEGTEVSWVAPAENTDGTNLTDLAGYNLYYGVASGNYTEVVPVNDASLTSFELPIAPGEYYMAMTAYDFDGNESELSNEIRQVIN